MIVLSEQRLRAHSDVHAFAEEALGAIIVRPEHDLLNHRDGLVGRPFHDICRGIESDGGTCVAQELLQSRVTLLAARQKGVRCRAGPLEPAIVPWYVFGPVSLEGCKAAGDEELHEFLGGFFREINHGLTFSTHSSISSKP